MRKHGTFITRLYFATSFREEAVIAASSIDELFMSLLKEIAQRVGIDMINGGKAEETQGEGGVGHISILMLPHRMD